MKVHGFGDPRLLVLCSALAVLGATRPARADTGGGSPTTPYLHTGEPSTADVTRMKQTAERLQTACLPPSSAPLSPLRSVGLVEVTPEVATQYADGGRMTAPPPGLEVRFAVEGETPEGARRTVSFAEIEAITIQEVREHRAVLRVVSWPTISPAELVALQPDYATLRAGFRATMSLAVELQKSDGKLLALLDTWNGRVVPLSSLPQGAEVRFQCWEHRGPEPRNMWWAIPSVAFDPKYPYRTIFKK